MILQAALLTILAATSGALSDPADQAWEAYLAGNFSRVERLVKDGAADRTLNDASLARLNLALGCSYAMLSRDQDAQDAFETALTLDPSIDLSPVDIPPPVWRLFEPVRARMPKPEATGISLHTDEISIRKGELSPSSPPDIGSKGATRLLQPPDTVRLFMPVIRSPSASVKSLIYPGWGHLTEGRDRGKLFAGIEAVCLAGWILSAIAADRARNDYLQTRDPDLISERYDRYDQYYRLAWGFGIAALATYITAQLDFFTVPPPVDTNIRTD